MQNDVQPTPPAPLLPSVPVPPSAPPEGKAAQPPISDAAKHAIYESKHGSSSRIYQDQHGDFGLVRHATSFEYAIRGLLQRPPETYLPYGFKELQRHYDDLLDDYKNWNFIYKSLLGHIKLTPDAMVNLEALVQRYKIHHQIAGFLQQHEKAFLHHVRHLYLLASQLPASQLPLFEYLTYLKQELTRFEAKLAQLERAEFNGEPFQWRTQPRRITPVPAAAPEEAKPLPPNLIAKIQALYRPRSLYEKLQTALVKVRETIAQFKQSYTSDFVCLWGIHEILSWARDAKEKIRPFSELEWASLDAIKELTAIMRLGINAKQLSVLFEADPLSERDNDVVQINGFITQILDLMRNYPATDREIDTVMAQLEDFCIQLCSKIEAELEAKPKAKGEMLRY